MYKDIRISPLLEFLMLLKAPKSRQRSFYFYVTMCNRGIAMYSGIIFLSLESALFELLNYLLEYRQSESKQY